MVIPRWFLWLLLHLLAFTAWIIYLEYGTHAWSHGLTVELQRLTQWTKDLLGF